MKGLNFLAAFLGGAAIGAAFGILFAPEKGVDTRQKIKDILREKGIKLNRSEMDELVDKIASEVKDAVDWFFLRHGLHGLHGFISMCYRNRSKFV